MNPAQFAVLVAFACGWLAGLATCFVVMIVLDLRARRHLRPTMRQMIDKVARAMEQP